MLITRFNRLIHNKIIWICFAFLVCVAFIMSGAGLSRGIRNANNQQQPEAGTLRGEKISMRDYQTALFTEQGLGHQSPKTDEDKLLLHEEAWKRLAAQKPISEMGITVSDQDVLDVIQHEFSQNGVFNKQAYLGILYEKLRMSEQSFEAYLRDVILFQKTARVFESCVWTPPAELNQRLKDLSDEFVLQYVLMDAEKMITTPTLTTSELKDFYAEHKESFEITEERQVRYVAFSITNHLPEIVVKDDDIQRYYQANQKKYAGAVSNGLALPPEVRKEIELTLQYEGATDKAREEAMALATALVKGRTTAPNSEAFLAQATALSLPVHTTAYFVAEEPIPGIASRDFNKSAFLLSRQRPISDAVLGVNSVYLMDLIDQRGPRTPDYEEVATKVETLAVFSKRHDTFREKAKEIQKAMEERLPKGESFKAIAESYALNVSTTTAFSVYNPTVSSNDAPIVEALSETIIQLKPGDMTPLLPTKRGALLAYVASRTAADPLLLQQGLKPQLMLSLNRYRAAAVMDDWKTYLLAQADLVDKVHKPTKEKESSASAPDDETAASKSKPVSKVQ